MVARYNADLANNLGNLLARVATVVGRKCGGVGPAPRARQPAGRGRRRGRTRRAAGGVGRRRSRPTPWPPPGGWSGRPTPTSRPTSRGRPSPGPAVDAVLGDALEALRIVAVLASPAVPGAAEAIWRPHRPARLAVDDQRLPDAAAWGGYPGGLPVDEGRRRSSPASSDAARQRSCRRGDRQPLPPRRRRLPGGADAALAAARAAGVEPLGLRRHRRRPQPRPPSPSPRAHDDVWATVGLHPHDASHGVDGIVGLLDRARGGGRRASAASTTTTTTRRATCSGRRSPPRSALAHERDLALVIHTREAWDDTFAILAAEGVPDTHGLPLLHRRARRGPAVPRPRAPTCRSPASSRFKTAGDVRAAAALCPARPAPRRDRRPVPGAGPPPGPAQRAGLRARWSARPSPRPRDRDIEAIAAVTTGNARIAFRLPPLASPAGCGRHASWLSRCRDHPGVPVCQGGSEAEVRTRRSGPPDRGVLPHRRGAAVPPARGQGRSAANGHPPSPPWRRAPKRSGPRRATAQAPAAARRQHRRVRPRDHRGRAQLPAAGPPSRRWPAPSPWRCPTTNSPTTRRAGRRSGAGRPGCHERQRPVRGVVPARRHHGDRDQPRQRAHRDVRDRRAHRRARRPASSSSTRRSSSSSPTSIEAPIPVTISWR